MTVNRHVLKGCSPTPLAHYLKALGILRLISEQKDPSCRGAWRADHFELATRLSMEDLERFFLEEYRPTALVSPWNKGSGFFIANDPGLSPIENSTSPRLQPYREGIAASRRLLTELAAADAEVRRIKDEPKKLQQRAREALKKSDEYKARLAVAERRFKSLKANLIPECRLTWRGTHLDWMNAAMVLDDHGEPSYPALLGTGGNDGRLDFTNNFMQRLAELFDLASDRLEPKPSARERLRCAIWELPANGVVTDASIGQYQPGAAGGANSTNGPSGAPTVNAWDFVLMLEGALLMAPAATKRLGPSSTVQASAPFSLRSQATGGGTFESSEESGRGEQWLPVWSRFATLLELKTLLSEGRAQVGRTIAARPIDMARAIGRLGVARGIQSFQRYAYLQRNGQSNFAVPLGRVAVNESPWALLVDDLVVWLDRLMREARDAAPARLLQAERHLSDAVFSALTHDHNPVLWQDVLIAAARVETVQAGGIALRPGPIPELRVEWAIACDDHSPEFRLAVALAGANAPYSSDGARGGPLRHHFLPIKAHTNAYRVSDDRLANDPRVVANGRDAFLDLAALFERRLVEAQQDGRRQPQILPAIDAQLQDLGAWLDGSVDANRCLELARAMMAIKHEHWGKVREQLYRPRTMNEPDEAWSVFRLCCLPFSIDQTRNVPCDPEIIRRLSHGDFDSAFRLARSRLASHGINPTLRNVLIDADLGKRWTSALAFPISRPTAKRLLKTIDPAAFKEEHHEYPA